MTAQHLTLPIRVVGGRLAATDQDSDTDIQTALLSIVSYPPGYRLDDPDFGARPALFEQNGANLQTIVDRVVAIDDRINPEAASDMIDRVQTIAINAGPDLT